MNKIVVFVFFSFLRVLSPIYCDTIEGSAASTPRVFYMPMVSYTSITLGDIQAHNVVGGLTLYRFDPNERDKLFSASLVYTPQVVTNINHDFPNLYHTAALTVMQKINRHIFNGTFIGLTEKPVYGGLRTVMGMAGYSYNLIKGSHFSMDLGGRLIFMDIGLKLNNGMSWLLWAIPSISLSWKYEWITFGFIPGVWMTIAPKAPVSFMFQTGSHKYDASLWYRYFKKENPSVEIMGIGVGIKRDSSNVLISDGGRYGINYDAIYGSFRLLRLWEISGGWAFNGREGYEQVNWETLFESAGYSDDSMYSENIGSGFFISVSFRMSF
jgi:hypothetical protein